MKYELTLTLRPMMYNLSAKEQFRISKEHLIDLFMPNGFPQYHISCIAELTGEHNIHYHCMIEIGSIEDKDKLMNKFNLFYSSVILGLIWGCWHFPAYLIGTGVPLEMNFMVFLLWVLLATLFISWIYYYTRILLIIQMNLSSIPYPR